MTKKSLIKKFEFCSLYKNISTVTKDEQKNISKHLLDQSSDNAVEENPTYCNENSLPANTTFMKKF